MRRNLVKPLPAGFRTCCCCYYPLARVPDIALRFGQGLAKVGRSLETLANQTVETVD